MRSAIYSTFYPRAEAAAINFSVILVFLVVIVVFIVIVFVTKEGNNGQGRRGIIGCKIGYLGTRGRGYILHCNPDITFLPPSSAAVALLVAMTCSSFPSATSSSLVSASDVYPSWSSSSRYFSSRLTTRLISPSLSPSSSSSPSPQESSNPSALCLRDLS